MSQRVETDESDDPAGAPTWMLTYADTMTLLLCFFVMMLTFSSPEPEHFQQFAGGPFPGTSPVASFPGSPDDDNLAGGERRLAASRLAPQGAEKPPLYEEASLDELRYYYPEMKVAEAEKFPGARVVRIPAAELFAQDGTLSGRGREILNGVVKITKSATYSVIVRVQVDGSAPEQEKGTRSLHLAVRAAQYLREKTRGICKEIAVSSDIQLGGSALEEGECEILLLEV